MAVFLVFFNFLFYRIVSAAMFDVPLTIWASVLIAISSTLISAYSGVLGAIYGFGKEDAADVYVLEKLAVVTLGACFLACLSSYLITLGFSSKLFEDISDWHSYRDLFEQDLVWFCIMIAIPVFTHLVFFFRKMRKYV